MSKTVQLPPIRIEPEYRDALEGIGHAMRPAPSMSSLVRQAVVEFVDRHQANSSAPIAPLSMTPETAAERPE